MGRRANLESSQFSSDRLDHDAAYIVYDDQCPFCARYTAMIRLKKAVPRVELVNARQPHAAVELLKERSVSLDDGMVLIWNRQIYFGAAALWKISSLSSGGRLLYRIVAFLFSFRIFANVMYPFLRAGRNLTLRILGREKILTHPVGARASDREQDS